jgi:uncharacterized protein
LKNSNYYVYVYIDPRDLKPFYYGMGKGSRKDAHKFDRALGEKTKQIGEIRKDGEEPLIRVLAHDLTKEQAVVIEATLIWQFKDVLTNKINGALAKKFRPPKSLHKEIVSFDYDNRLWFFNVGDGPHRRWEDNIRYSYVGAGQKDMFRDAIVGLNPGDAIAAYLSKKGYVGVGKVVGTAKPASKFRLSDGSLLIDKPSLAPDIRDNLSDLENCEWMVPVEWKATVARSQARFRRNAGLFAPRSVRASLTHSETVKFIEQEFGIRDLFAFADAPLR